MDQRARNYIAQISEFILNEYEIQSPIHDIDEIVSRLNGCIYSVDNALVDSNVVRLDDQDFAFMITVSSCQPAARRTFAIAHEIGHLFLHMGYLSDLELWQSYGNHASLENYTEKEFQAHEFASNFLMPQKEYLEFVSNHTVNHCIDAYEIANYFGVSESMATIRGKLIGALKWA
ncbi:MAG: ImmA/IrrE family metallo-endopeptidase [Eubacteriales bacterium]